MSTYTKRSVNAGRHDDAEKRVSDIYFGSSFDFMIKNGSLLSFFAYSTCNRTKTKTYVNSLRHAFLPITGVYHERKLGK